MKKTSALFLAICLALGTAGTARADWDRHGPQGGYRSQHHHHGEGPRSGSDWIGPAAILAITGLAIGAAVYSQANAAPAYVAPPPAPAYQPPPDSGSWYYCQPYGQYYPYVRECPEPWQAVMPPR